MDVSSINANVWINNESDCKELIEREWDKIPLLNSNDVQNLQDSKLVRFRGMVQDMYNPEYYLEKYEVVHEVTTESSMKNGKYMDTLHCKEKEMILHESDKNITGERHTYFVVSPPGLNTWAEDKELELHKTTIEKIGTSTSPNKPTKRTLEVDSAEPMEMETKYTEEASTSSKKQCTELPNKTNETPIVSPEHLLNFPLPGRSGKSCHLKVYKDSKSIKLNDLIEFAGFLSVDPILSHHSHEENLEESFIELQTHNPPPSLIPRIHCVSFKKIEHSNPLFTNKVNMDVTRREFLRKELHIVLTQLLLGDELAAEYFLFHLISKVYLRKDLMAIGKFSINISNIPLVLPNYGVELYNILELLVPRSHYLPMTLENMNDLPFIPKKDYECNRITSGVLQLSNNTHLVLDETKLTSGKLNDAGVKAISAISNVIKNQKTVIDFKYYPMEFDCDIPFIVLSEGKSLLPSDCHIPLSPEEICISTFSEIIGAAKIFLKPDLLDEIRIYLTLTRHADYELSDNVLELVQAEFVNMRKNEKATADDLHNLLIIARLVCLAEGKNTLDDVCWKRACELETMRKARLPTSK